MKGKCYRCGSTSHRSSKHKLDKNSKCSKWGKLGHLAKVCQSAKTNSVVSADEGKSPQTASAAEVNTEQTVTCHTVNMSRDYNDTDVPTALLWLCQDNGKPFQIKATPDTGCSVAIMRDGIAKFDKLKLKRSNLPRLLTATGQRMNVSGRANVTVTANNQTEKIDILVIFGPWCSSQIFPARTRTKSLLILTFLLSQGKFRYLRAPLGLRASSVE